MLNKTIITLATSLGCVSGQAQSIGFNCENLTRVYQENVNTYILNNPTNSSGNTLSPSVNPGSSSSYDWITPSKDFEKACNERGKQFIGKQQDAFIEGVKWRANFRVDGGMWYEIEKAVPSNLSEDEKSAFIKGAGILGVGY